MFNPAFYNPAFFDTAEPVQTVGPAPIFIVTRDDAGTPYSFTSPFKDPDAIERPGMDWSGWLPDGESIAAHEVFADSEEITIDQVARATGIVSWRIAGGVAGQDYIVTCRITTSTGLIDDRSVRVPVRPR